MLKLNKLLNLSPIKIRFNSFIKTKKLGFSSGELLMPIIDMDKFMNKREGWEKECKLTADCLHETGILVVKDNVIK
jgi:hypothetical protein